MDFYSILEAMLLPGVKSCLFTLNRHLLPHSGGHTKWHFQVELTDGVKSEGNNSQSGLWEVGWNFKSRLSLILQGEELSSKNAANILL